MPGSKQRPLPFESGACSFTMVRCRPPSAFPVPMDRSHLPVGPRRVNPLTCLIKEPGERFVGKLATCKVNSFAREVMLHAAA